MSTRCVTLDSFHLSSSNLKKLQFINMSYSNLRNITLICCGNVWFLKKYISLFNICESIQLIWIVIELLCILHMRSCKSKRVPNQQHCDFCRNPNLLSEIGYPNISGTSSVHHSVNLSYTRVHIHRAIVPDIHCKILEAPSSSSFVGNGIKKKKERKNRAWKMNKTDRLSSLKVYFWEN